MFFSSSGALFMLLDDVYHKTWVFACLCVAQGIVYVDLSMNDRKICRRVTAWPVLLIKERSMRPKVKVCLQRNTQLEDVLEPNFGCLKCVIKCVSQTNRPFMKYLITGESTIHSATTFVGCLN